jgi:hypothetical protein
MAAIGVFQLAWLWCAGWPGGTTGGDRPLLMMVMLSHKATSRMMAGKHVSPRAADEGGMARAT